MLEKEVFSRVNMQFYQCSEDNVSTYTVHTTILAYHKLVIKLSNNCELIDNRIYILQLFVDLLQLMFTKIASNNVSQININDFSLSAAFVCFFIFLPIILININ